MTSNRVTVNIHVRGSGSDGGPGRYLPGANHQETVQALEKVGFRKTADVTEISVTLDGDVEQLVLPARCGFWRGCQSLEEG